jgi:uncharacterized pyridoxamine 5'-phosphate oxidase family protein
MVTITSDAKEMMDKQKVILVGTSNKRGIPNLSPRSSFYVDNDAIYWYEIFKHKSYQNFMKNNWVSISVIDNVKFSGYQLKGKVEMVEDERKFFDINAKISENIPKDHEELIRKLIRENGVKVVQFKPIALYSLNPLVFEETSGLLESDADIDKLDDEFSMLDYV